MGAVDQGQGAGTGKCRRGTSTRRSGFNRFKNDRSLSDDEIETIVGWVDAGAPQGNPTDGPAPIEWPDPNAWRLAEQFGEPDLIVPSEPYTVPADGQDKWWKSTDDTGLTAERWVKAIEIKPSFPLGRKGGPPRHRRPRPGGGRRDRPGGERGQPG